MRFFVVYVIACAALQLAQPFGISDYPEAINLPCMAMLRGESPYSVVCTSGNPMSPGPGYLLLLLVSGLFLIPNVLPFLGIAILGVSLFWNASEHYHGTRSDRAVVSFLAVVAVLLIRSTILGIDYLFAGGALWLALSSLDC